MSPLQATGGKYDPNIVLLLGYCSVKRNPYWIIFKFADDQNTMIIF